MQARSRKLVDPNVHTAIHEIDLARDHVHAPAGKERMTYQVAYLQKLGTDLQAEATVVVALRVEILECFADESESQVHRGLVGSKAASYRFLTTAAVAAVTGLRENTISPIGRAAANIGSAELPLGGSGLARWRRYWNGTSSSSPNALCALLCT